MFRKEYHEDLKKLDLYNVHEFKAEPKEFIPLEFEPEEYDPVLIELGLNVLKSINNGEEFIYKFAGTSHVKGFLYDVDSLVGLNFGDMYPWARDELYSLFNEVLVTRNKEVFKISFYNDDELSREMDMRIIPHGEDEIYFFFEDRTDYSVKLKHLIEKNAVLVKEDAEKTAMLDEISQKNQEILTLNEVVKDVESAASLAVLYMDADGKWYYPDEAYEILERERRPGDEYKTIFADIMPKEFVEIRNKIVETEKPGEIHNDGTIWPLYLENGKVKYIKAMSRLINDEDGNFIRKSYLIRDVTEEYLNTTELNILNEAFEDVQKATLTGIDYRDLEGKYHWTPEIYEIIDRAPRDGDEDYDIILSLADDETYTHMYKLVEELPLDEFLPEEVISITTESGINKFLKLGARKVTDEKGEYLRFIGYTQDVTAQVQYEKDLIQADYEKTVLIQEVHHRVKNNLQLITSFINLEKRFNDDPEVILDITQNRLKSLALIHETIYSEKDLSTIILKPFFKDFDQHLFMFTSSKDIEFVWDIDEDLRLYVDIVTPLTLMINELTTNTYKYAFPDGFEGEKQIFKSIHTYEEKGVTICEFKYSDSGIGMPEDFDIDKSRSLGWTIIKSLVGQLDGEFELFNDNGMNFVLKFPLK